MRNLFKKRLFDRLSDLIFDENFDRMQTKKNESRNELDSFSEFYKVITPEIIPIKRTYASKYILSSYRKSINHNFYKEMK